MAWLQGKGLIGEPAVSNLTPPEFTDDEGLIAKGSSVVVRRIPVVGARSSSNAKIRNMYVFLALSADSPRLITFFTLPLVVCVCICLRRNVHCSGPEILLKVFTAWWIFLCFVDISTTFTSHCAGF